VARPDAPQIQWPREREVHYQPLSSFFSAEAAENFAALLAAIWMVSPVAGLRPSRADAR